MTTFGTLPGDVVTNSRGDVQAGVTLSLYATAADAAVPTGLLATVTTDAEGRWSYTDAARGVVWVRTPVGRVYSTVAPDALPGTTDASALTSGTLADARLPVTAQAATLSSTYARKGRLFFDVKDYGAVGDGVTDDTAAIVAAIAAAHASTAWNTPVAVVWFSFGRYLTDPITFDALRVTPLGAGPQNVTIVAKSTNTDYLMTFPSGWLGKAANNLWRTPIGGFQLQGSSTAASTAFVPGETAQALNGGIRIDSGFAVDLHDISIREMGGPDLWMRNIVLSRFSNIVLNRPIGADTNAVPYFYSTGWTNENAFNDFLFQSGGSPDGPAVVHIDQDAAYASMNQGRWSGTQFENMHTPAGGAIWDTRSSTTTYEGSMYEDCTGVTGNTSVMRFRGTGAAGGLGGSNRLGGLVYSVNYTRGVLVEQSNNVIEGPGTAAGLNVEIASGVTYSHVALKGLPITSSTVLDNSGNTTNVIVNPAVYASVTRTNLCTNPNFEADASGWLAYSGSTALARSTVTPYAGTGRLIFAGNDVASSALVYMAIPGVPGDTLTITAKVRCDGQAIAQIRALIDYPGATGNVIANVTYTTGVDGWKEVSATAIMPAGGTNFRAVFGVNSGGGATSSTTCTVGLDQVLIEKSPKLGAYFDGSTTDTTTVTHAWTAAANASTSRETPSTVKAAAITTPTAPSAAYVQAEAAAAKTAIDAILATLKANGLSA